MTVYHTMTALLLVFGLLMHGEQRRNLKYVLVGATLLFCVMGLRYAYTVGIDSTGPYATMYGWTEKREWSDMPTLSDWLQNTEEYDEEADSHSRNIGIRWLMKIVSDVFDGDYQAFLAVEAAIVMISIAHFVYRYSPSPLQSFLYYLGLLIYCMQFSALKQSIAMSILLLAVDAIIDKKPIRFVLLTLFASMFHFPALVFLPAYFIGNIRLGRMYLIFLAGLFALTYLFRDQLLNMMTDAYDTAIAETGMRFLANKVLVMLIIIVSAVVIRPPSSEDRVYNTFLMFTGVAAVIQTFASFNNTFERLADYYFQTAIVFIPMVFEEVKLERMRLSDNELVFIRKVGPIIFGTFAIWRFLNYVRIPDAHLTPYDFYFTVEHTVTELSASRFF